MINIVEFIDRLADLTKKNQSGFDAGKGITGKINQCQLELAEYLHSIYEVNQKAVDLLAPLIIKVSPISSNATGLITKPENYNHLLALRFKKGVNEIHKTQYIGTNQVSIISKIPQRKADLTKNRVLYTFTGEGITVYPAQALSFEMVYVKYPKEAKIGYTYTNVNNEPKRVVDPAKTENLEWGMNCFNLLLYMVMDKMGLSVRDHILSEYAQLGIAREQVKTIN